jgi:crotonobetainyl-CoA:carnitine CoA-transferase CaiB-like acyl-CoA transferase
VARKQNETGLDETITALLADREGPGLERDLQAAGVKACRVIKPYDLTDDAGLQQRSFFQELSREASGTHAFKTWPFRFSSIDAAHKRQPPLLGEHNEAILRELLGLSDDELARLEEASVIGREPIAIRTQNY